MAIEAPNWSATLKDLLNEGDTQEARRLLEGLVAKLQSRSDAPSNLTLAEALSDLASLYSTLGLPSLAHSASSSALLIKRTAQSCPSTRSSVLSTPTTDHVVTSCISDKAKSRTEEGASADVEEEWESLLSKDIAQLDALSLPKSTIESVPCERNMYKQRGRGAFTHGEMGMYIDRITSLPKEMTQLDVRSEDDKQDEDVLLSESKVTYGVRHVLVVSFSPSVTTRDLEELFEPFGLGGVAVRWVNDTTALAVFRNPETAKDAFQSTKSPRFRLRPLDEDDAVLDLIKKEDLQPPVPRPATSAEAAHRMIMGALQRQGGRKKTSSRDNFKSSQELEFERKQRLRTRQKLRDEAWGSED